jgi:phosphoribosyl 1,2-cyclic phosphodiesterase
MDGAGRAAMITFSLQSGSNGNSIYVEAGEVRLLFDAGISAREIMGRLARHDRNIRRLTAVLISHEHCDHTRGAGVLQRKFKVPVYLTMPTHRAIGDSLGPLGDVRYFLSGDTLTFGDVQVHTLRTPHDAVDGVAFVVEHAGRRLGIFSDLGHPFAALRTALDSVDAAYLESNYDPHMLANSEYPARLKERIRGDSGHLSNEEAAELLRGCTARERAWVALAHLSQVNNHPDVALETHRRVLGPAYPLFVAGRHAVTEIRTV